MRRVRRVDPAPGVSADPPLAALSPPAAELSAGDDEDEEEDDDEEDDELELLDPSSELDVPELPASVKGGCPAAPAGCEPGAGVPPSVSPGNGNRFAAGAPAAGGLCAAGACPCEAEEAAGAEAAGAEAAGAVAAGTGAAGASSSPGYGNRFAAGAAGADGAAFGAGTGAVEFGTVVCGQFGSSTRFPYASFTR